MHTRLLLMTVLLCHWGSVAVGQSGVTVDKSHMSGLFAAHAARIESWRQGDVLIKVNSSGSGGLFGVRPGPDDQELLTEETGYTRFIFDLDRKKFLVAKRTQGTATVFDGLGNQLGDPVQAGVNKVGIYDAERGLCLLKESDGKVQDLMRIMRSEHVFIGMAGVNVFMGLGFNWQPQKGWYSQSDIWRDVSEYEHVDAIRSIDNIGQNRYQVLSVVETPGRGPGGTRIFTEWDVKRQVPVHFTHYAGVKSDPEKPFSLRPNTSHSAEWGEFHGEWLPKLARGMARQAVLFQGKDYGNKLEFEIQVHWFSLNQEIPDETFDVEVLRDVDKQTALLDPSCFEEK